jgi:hypothetical protein
MPYSITTRDGITIQNIPDDVPPDAPELKQRVAAIRAQRGAAPAAPAVPEQPYTAPPAARPVETGPAPTLGQRLIGAGEAALTALTGATGGAAGMIGGTVGGLAGSILSGQFGTPEAAQEVERAAMEQAQRFTYQPRTRAGREATEALGEFVQQVAPPVLPQIAAPGMAIQAVGQQVPLATATAGRVAAAAAPTVRTVAQAPVRVTRAAGRAVGLLPPDEGSLAAGSQSSAAMQRGAMGASGATVGGERQVVAATMPVPFEGRAGLTAGQASRDFAQLQFERDSAKIPDLGQPLRERMENQTAVMIQNFDALIDLPQRLNTDPRSMGMAVDRALVNRVEVQRNRIRDLYQQAREAGAMESPVEMAPLLASVNDLARFEGLVPGVRTIRNEAVRLGALVPDADGNLTPGVITLDNAELLRQFVNEATDWTNRREALVGTRIKNSIDAATEGAGGEAYRRARKARAQFAEEFENVGLTSKLLGTKRGTDDRQVAFADVFDKVIILSPVEEMNKLRGTLLRAGPDGRQAWNDLKGAGIQYIKDTAFSPSERDAAGNPLFRPNQMAKIVRSLDQDGKLEALYGKRQAQVLRDLSELGNTMFTAPPGAINHSNTASAMRLVLDSMLTGGVTTMLAGTPLPAPAVTAFREASRYVRDRKTRARIEAALRGQMTTD